MAIRIDMSGLEKLKAKMEELANTTEESFGEIYPPEFISSHSSFADIDSLFKASGFKAETMEDLEAIPDEEWDAFISSNTDFDSWSEMREAAMGEYVKKKLSF